VTHKRTATDSSLLDTSPGWEITQKLVAHERKIARAGAGDATTESGLATVSELVAAEKKRAQKPPRRRRSR
jgi:hypothetical protein